jgi:hypothetical protein
LCIGKTTTSTTKATNTAERVCDSCFNSLAAESLRWRLVMKHVKHAVEATEQQMQNAHERYLLKNKKPGKVENVNAVMKQAKQLMFERYRKLRQIERQAEDLKRVSVFISM